jgi:hypothetical protein
VWERARDSGSRGSAGRVRVVAIRPTRRLKFRLFVEFRMRLFVELRMRLFVEFRMRLFAGLRT